MYLNLLMRLHRTVLVAPAVPSNLEGAQLMKLRVGSYERYVFMDLDNISDTLARPDFIFSRLLIDFRNRRSDSELPSLRRC